MRFTSVVAGLDPSLLTLLREEAAEGARRGALTGRSLAALREARLFKMFLPESLGGLALSLPAACETIAAISAADGAAGWAVMIGSGPNWFAGCMPDRLAAEVFAPAHSCVAGAAAPGIAIRAAGGWEVTGCWRWCSGAPWATHFTFNVREDTDEFVIVVPAAEAHVDADTWLARGLAATASQTVRVQNLYVPQARTFRTFETARTRTEAIFRVPFATFAELTMAACAIGIGQALLAEFREYAGRKVPAMSSAALAAQDSVCATTARALARWQAARAAWRAALRTLWDAILTAPADAAPDSSQLLDAQLASLEAVHTVREIARRLRPWLGMDALIVDSRLGRLVEDAFAVGQNAVVAEARFEAAGREWFAAGAGASVSKRT
jgi:alkylation response protein AidB-like acyl-CoA dehydrogenase